ncbi:MAG: isoprenylcysteine carboxyl methyltransferase family protein [Stellaceae bacterium]
MSPVALAVGLVAAERLCELALAQRNTRALKRAGAVEYGRGHYPLIVALHAAWLGALYWRVPAETPANLPLAALYIPLQGLRFWTLATLGRYWTTRIIILPGAPLVRRGPYRLLRHPNYAIVAGEIALLPLVFGAWRLALLFSVANLALLAWRIAVEERALAPRREAQASPQT